MAPATLRASIGPGLAAGFAGTAVMTGLQLAVRKARGEPLDTPVPEKWADAPAPAQLAKKAAKAVGQGRRIKKAQVPLITNLLHWGYGLWWGTVYGVAEHALREDPRAPNPLRDGPLLGAGLWAASYTEFVPLGIYKPPWKYPPKVLALDLAYHLAYGLTVVEVYKALETSMQPRVQGRSARAGAHLGRLRGRSRTARRAARRPRSRS
jgi:hypothetical protein